MTLSRQVSRELHRLFDEWTGAGSRGAFRDFVRREDKDLLDVVEMKTDLMSRLRVDVQRALGQPSAPRPVRRLSTDLIALFMGQIGAAYMRDARDGDTIEDFIERLRLECPDEETLRARLLGERRP